MQPEPTLVEFADYNVWATAQLMTICMGLDEDILKQDIPGTAGPILATFQHLLRAEAGFLKRIHGMSPQPAFEWDEGPELSEMVDYAVVLGEALKETIMTVSPLQNVHEEDNTWTFDYQARLIFMSLVYHGIVHRSDITTFLNTQNVPLPELDIWGYQAAHPDRFQAKMMRKSEG